MKITKFLSATALLFAFTTQFSLAADIRLETAAENSFSDYYLKVQKPYFDQTLSDLTDGRVTANAVPFDQLGLTGFEMMRLLSRRTLDIVSGTMAYVTQDYPALEGGSLAGIAPNLQTFRDIYSGYRPVIDEIFETKYNSKILMIYPYPQSRIFCNFPGKAAGEITFADLKGKSVRSFGATVSDLIEGLGATPVTMAFAEVPAAIQRGALDCFASSVVGAYQSKAYQVLTHSFDMNVNYSTQFVAINTDSFNGLSPADQEILVASMKEMEDAMMKLSEELEVSVPNCLAAGPCAAGATANLIEVKPSVAEQATIKQLVADYVLARWAARCGSDECVQKWNDTAGKALNISASR